VLLFNITFIAGWVVTKISIVDIFSSEGIDGAQRIFGALFQSEMVIFDDSLFAIIETIYIALLATLISIPPTLLLNFFTTRNLMKENKISSTIYRWDINVKMATIIGLVGGGGIGTMLMQYQGLARWHEIGSIVIMIVFVVWIMDYISAKIREAIY